MPTDVGKGLDERAIPRVGGVCNQIISGRAIGEDRESVVGRGVTVDADAIEGRADRLAQGLLERCFADGGVGGDQAEQGGHHRVDHPRPLGDSGNRGTVSGLVTGRLPGQGDCPLGTLGSGIGGHDRLGHLPAILPREVRRCLTEAGIDLLHIEPDANHPSRSDQHLPIVAMEVLGDEAGGLFGVGQSFIARAGVGTASVDHEDPVGRCP